MIIDSDTRSKKKNKPYALGCGMESNIGKDCEYDNFINVVSRKEK